MEPDQDQSPPPTILEYAKPAPRVKWLHWHRTWKVSIIFVTFALGFILVDCLGPSQSIWGVLLILIAAIYSFYCAILKPMITSRASTIDDDEEDKKWQEKEKAKQLMLTAAQRMFANGPLGCWRDANIETRKYGAPIVYADRYIQFSSNGTGCYAWKKAGSNAITIESIFEFKINAERELMVRMKIPALDKWVSIAHGFDASLGNDGEQDLSLWFDSTNPLIAEFTEYWPFWGEFDWVKA